MTVEVTTYQYRVQYVRTQTDGEPRTREPKNHLGPTVCPETSECPMSVRPRPFGRKQSNGV